MVTKRFSSIHLFTMTQWFIVHIDTDIPRDHYDDACLGLYGPFRTWDAASRFATINCWTGVAMDTEHWEIVEAKSHKLLLK